MSRFSEIIYACAASGVPRRSLAAALVVGTLLNLINQSDVLLGSGHFAVGKAILTFLVPYCVATYGAVSSRLGTGRPPT